jgi:hypothetical protein
MDFRIGLLINSFSKFNAKAQRRKGAKKGKKKKFRDILEYFLNILKFFSFPSLRLCVEFFSFLLASDSWLLTPIF